MSCLYQTRRSRGYDSSVACRKGPGYRLHCFWNILPRYLSRATRSRGLELCTSGLSGGWQCLQQVLVAQLTANPYMPIQHTYSWVQLLRRKHPHTFFHNAAEADVEAGTSSDAPTGAAGSTATAKEDKPLNPKTTEATDGALLILHIDSIRQQHCNNATVEASHTVHTRVPPCMIHWRPEPSLLTDLRTRGLLWESHSILVKTASLTLHDTTFMSVSEKSVWDSQASAALLGNYAPPMAY